MRTISGTLACTALFLGAISVPIKHWEGRSEPELAGTRFGDLALESGDLIFRSGTNVVSRAVLGLDSASSFSHVGIVYLAGDEPLVIHAIPGENLWRAEPLRIDSLADYLSDENTTSVAIMRLIADATEIRKKAADAALSFAQDGVLFDGKFDTESSDRMYCTELVWRAYKAVGLDLIDGSFDKVRGPLFSRPRILTSSLLTNPHLKEVFSVVGEIQ